MKKNLAVFSLSVGLSVFTAASALALGWQQNEVGWWYGTNADNSTWHSNGWQWIDGNSDGIAECYYFDGNGYMASNTVIDGSTVDGNGAWVVDGVVQTKSVGGQQNNSELQRWIGTYEKIDDKNCTIEVYGVDENGITVGYEFSERNDTSVGLFVELFASRDHHLAFQNGNTYKAYGTVSLEDRGDISIGAVGLPETYELMGDGSIRVTFTYPDDATSSQDDKSWVAFNGVYKKTGTAVRDYVQTSDIDNINNSNTGDYSDDGVLDMDEIQRSIDEYTLERAKELEIGLFDGDGPTYSFETN